MCVWHSQNRGQIHIPFSGLPQNTLNKNTQKPVSTKLPQSHPQNNKSIETRSNNISFRSPIGLPFVTLSAFFQKVSQSAPLAPQARPGAPKSFQNKDYGCQTTDPGSSKWRLRVSKCSPRGSEIRSKNHTQGILSPSAKIQVSPL